MDTANYDNAEAIDFDSHSFGDHSCNGETISYVPDMPSPPFPSNLFADVQNANNANNPWFNPFDDLGLPSITSMVNGMITDDDNASIPILGAFPITPPQLPMANHLDNLSPNHQLLLPQIDDAKSQGQIHSFYNPNPPNTEWPQPITLPLPPFVFDPPNPPMTVDPIIDDPFHANYRMSDYQRYQQLVASNAHQHKHSHSHSSSSSSERTESSSPPNSADPKTPSFQRSVFHSPQDQCFGANECGQTYLSSEDEAFRFEHELNDDFDLNEMAEISMESMQNDEKSTKIVKCEKDQIEQLNDDDEKDEIVKKVHKIRRRRRRRRHRHSRNESSRSRSHSKTEKTSKNTKKTKAKKQLKRNRKCMEQKDDSSKECNKKRRRLSSESQSEVISQNVNDYIAETMSTKECRVIFHQMIKRKEVICTEEGNWCNIGRCGQIKKRFGKKCHLKRHVDEEHIGRRFRCTFPNCSYDALGKRFRQKGPAKEHINNTHFDAQSQWKCCFCEDPFSRYNGVKRHLILKRCKFMKNHCDEEKIQEIINKVKEGKLQAKCKVF